jgi:hypothetical protein
MVIPTKMTDTDQYWHAVAEKCFIFSTQIGSPTLFLTFRMNPYWPEYESLKRGSENFSDLSMASIVFRARLKCLLDFWKRSQVRVTVRGFVWRVEYQQRGLPHGHILFWMDSDISNPEEIDRIINARYPENSPLINEQKMINDRGDSFDTFRFTTIADATEKANICKYGYLKQMNSEIRTHNHLYIRSTWKW